MSIPSHISAMLGVAVSLLAAAAASPAPAAEALPVDPTPRVLGADRFIAVRGGGYFPVLVRMRSGELGAVVRGGAGHVGRGGRLDFIRSKDGGRSWSSPSLAVDSEWDDRNPALGEMPDGTLVLAYAEARSYRPDGIFDLRAGPYLPCMITSTDCGKTWSGKRAFPAPFPNPSPFGRIIVLADSTAVLGIYQMPSERAGILRSSDGGKTWGDFSPIPGHDETQLLEVPGGRLLAFGRIEEDGEHGLLLSESDDKGRTWPRTRRLLRARQWPFDATLLSSGRVLLSFGSRAGRFGAGVLLGDVGGKTWDERRALLIGADSDGVDTGYPSTVELPDGAIITLYYAVGTSLAPGAQAIAVRYAEEDLLKVAGERR